MAPLSITDSGAMGVMAPAGRTGLCEPGTVNSTESRSGMAYGQRNDSAMKAEAGFSEGPAGIPVGLAGRVGQVVGVSRQAPVRAQASEVPARRSVRPGDGEGDVGAVDRAGLDRSHGAAGDGASVQRPRGVLGHVQRVRDAVA